MNHISLRTLRVSLLLVGASLYLVGCGPENLDDPAYLAQMGEAGVTAADDETKKDDATASAEDPQGSKDMAPPAGDAAIVAKPVVGVVAPVVAVAPVVQQLPDVHVKLPPRFAPKPDILTASGEARGIVQNRFHHRDIFVPQKTLNTHTIHTATTINDKFQDRIIEQPSFGNRIVHTASAARTMEVLPTLHTVAPAVNFGTIGVGIAPILPGPCARYLSGGFRRYCGGPLAPAIAPLPVY